MVVVTIARMVRREIHRIARIGWLRAAVLGANDGIISTASLMLGIGAASAPGGNMLFAGVAALAAGAMAMAAGEFVSVSSQSDAERAALTEEQRELQADSNAELRELASIYVGRGVEACLARQVARQLMEHDALGAHARDELGINDLSTARPLQAALSSAASFASGAIVPLVAALLFAANARVSAVAIVSLSALAILGWTAARIGGAPPLVSMARVVLWGALAMGVTAAVGHLVGG